MAADQYPQLDMFSPMRSKNFLEKTRKIKGTSDSYGSATFGQASGILGRDYNDVKEAKVIIANFLGSQIGSLGTAAEFGFAHALQIPVVMIVEPKTELQALEAVRREAFRLDLISIGCSKELAVDVLDLMDQRKQSAFGNPHDHVFLNQIATYIVHDLDEALMVTASLVTPGI